MPKNGVPEEVMIKLPPMKFSEAANANIGPNFDVKSDNHYLWGGFVDLCLALSALGALGARAGRRSLGSDSKPCSIF